MSNFSQFNPKFTAANFRYFINDQYTPKDYVECDNSVLSKSTYPNLFSKIGNLPSKVPTAVTSISTGTGSGIWQMIYGNGLYVIVGDSGMLRTSTNAVNWTGRTSGTSSTIRSIAYGNGTYVYVGNGGVLSSSTNAINWTARTSGTTSSIFTVAYGAGIFAYGGTSDIDSTNTPYATSTDGANWTLRAYNGRDTIHKLEFTDSGVIRVVKETGGSTFRNFRYGVIGTYGTPQDIGNIIYFIGGGSNYPLSRMSFIPMQTNSTRDRNLFVLYSDSFSADRVIRAIWNDPNDNGAKTVSLMDSGEVPNVLEYDRSSSLYALFTSSTGNVRTSTDGVNWTKTVFSGLSFTKNTVLIHNDSIFVAGSGGNMRRFTLFTHNTSIEYQLPNTNNFSYNFQLDNQIIENLTTYIKTK
jgi:hypothetical protein